ncbi:MAG TPA: molybdenum cofactor guanylyltransferase [Dehalococcoidales bacterium]
MELTGIILAGGRNLRLGRNKALEKIGGVTVIERVINRLTPIINQLIIVTADGKNHLIPVSSARFKADVYPGKGPLGGIYTGLSASHTELNIAVACDMPFLSTSLLKHMVELIPGFDAVVPRTRESLFEPLHAVYSQTCLPVIKNHLELEQLSIRAFLAEVKVRYIEEDECRQYDPELLSFFNMNRQADLERAMKIAGSKQSGII